MKYEVFLTLTINTSYVVDAEDPQMAEALAGQEAYKEYEDLTEVQVDQVEDCDAEFEIRQITLDEFINDSGLRNSSPAWYFDSRLVHMDHSCPYIIVKGDVVEVPSDAVLTDW